MKKITVLTTLLLSTISLLAQSEWLDPSVASLSKDTPRSGLISYDIREDAQKGIRDNSPFYLPLKMESYVGAEGNKAYYITQTQIPYGWLDRDLFIHINGSPAFYLYINDKMVGYGTDSRAATEFNISKHVNSGINTIRIESIAGSSVADLEFDKSILSKAPLGLVYLYSQPKTRIVDYTISGEPDSLGKNGVLKLQVAVSNSYNAPETITVGYDIYSPAGKLQYYDMSEAKLPGNGRDTVRFKEIINGAMQNLWSAEKPNLYRVMIYLKRDGRIIEYIPMKIGFGKTEFKDQRIVRNGKVLDVNAVRYNGIDQGRTKTDLLKLRSAGINTVCPDYPQSDWFYDLCESVGMYVIDQANINNPVRRDDLTSGGTTSNDPRRLSSYIERTESMYARNRNRCCIVAWSMGGASGNGYNMYRSYQWLKQADSLRAVIYRDADGEWNSDMEYPQTVEPAQALAKAAAQAAKKPAKRR